MWENKDRLKSSKLKPQRAGSHSSNTSQSSSTSSDSSDVSSDDQQTIEMIKSSIPKFDYLNRNTINNTQHRYALLVNQINHEIKCEKVKLKELRK